MTYSVERLLWILDQIHHTATNTFEPDMEIVRLAEAGLNDTILPWEGGVKNSLPADGASVTPHEEREPEPY